MSDSDDDELLNLSSDKKKSKWRKMIFQETSEKELGNFIIQNSKAVAIIKK